MTNWLHCNRTRGKETITFEYDEAWLRNPARFDWQAAGASEELTD